MQIGNKSFDFTERTYIMGILNVTPDSFSDGGKWNQLDAALRHAETLVSEGADIIDIGGESTRPGHVPVSDEEETDRICPVIEGVKARFDIPISADTYKGSVAKAAIESGADLINDVWGLKHDKEMGAVISAYKKPCVLMHNKDHSRYEDLLPNIVEELKESLAIARRYGIPDEQIILDIGIGFAKDDVQNLKVLHHLEYFKEQLPYPWLLGLSRKRFIGAITGLDTGQRLESTIASNVLGAMKGQNIIRVHDVAPHRKAMMVVDAIIREGESDRSVTDRGFGDLCNPWGAE